MRNIISIVALGLVTVTQPIFASTWERLQPFKGRADMNSVAMRTANNGLCVGAGGVIRRTTSRVKMDAMPSILWQPVESGTVQDLYDVSYGNLGTVVIAGNKGTLLRGISDAGPFKPLSINTTQALRASAWRGNTVVVVGDNGTILQSVDAGATFAIIDGVTDSSLIDVNVDSKGRWYTIGRHIMLYSDDLISWHEMEVGGIVEYKEIDVIQRMEPLTGSAVFVCGNPWHIRVTADQGKTWDRIWPTNSLLYAFPRSEIKSFGVSSNGLRMTVFLEDRYTPREFHFVTATAGTSWIEQYDELSSYYTANDVVYADDTTFAAVGANGLTLTHTYNSLTRRWRAPEHMPLTTYFRNGVTFGDRVVMSADASDATIYSGDTTFTSFTVTFFPGDGFKSSHLTHVNNSNVLFAADSTWSVFTGTSLTGYSRGNIFRSTDAGATFARVHTMGDSIGHIRLCVSKAGTGFAVPYGKNIVVTHDAGATWKEQLLEIPNTVAQAMGANINDDAWIVFTYDTVAKKQTAWRSTNRGATWSPTPAPFTPSSITVLDNGRVVMVGSRPTGVFYQQLDLVAVSDDKGLSWTYTMQAQNPPGFFGLRELASRNNRVLAVGEASKLLASADFGSTFIADTTSLLVTEMDLFTDAFFTSSDAAIVLTNSGVILKTIRTEVATSFAQENTVRNAVLVHYGSNGVTISAQDQIDVNSVLLFDILGRKLDVEVVPVSSHQLFLPYSSTRNQTTLVVVNKLGVAVLR